jgi:uncharacterized membrane protein YeaQ/YmgE (transglycosylase-associated protein family)
LCEADNRLNAGYPAFCCSAKSAAGAASLRLGDAHMGLEPISLLALLVVGAIAGWLAGKIVNGYGFGLIGNIIIGIVGAAIGAFILGKLGILIGGGVLAWVINATIGAVILLVIIGLFKRA